MKRREILYNLSEKWNSKLRPSITSVSLGRLL